MNISRQHRIDAIRVWLKQIGKLESSIAEHGPIEEWDQRFIDNIYEDEMRGDY